MPTETDMIQNTIHDTSENCLSRDNTIATWVTNPYLGAATSDNTRKAYRNDIRHYENWGGQLPATPESIVNYLQAFALSKNSRTLERRLIALRHWHTYQAFPDPTAHPIVKKTMTGITRIHGKPRTKSSALLPDDLQKMVQALLKDPSLLSIRDNAILQIGFFGALRRSEIIHMRYEHLIWQKEGVEILLPFSKTDQMHQGQYCAIPYGNNLLCPVKALENWLTQSSIKEGAIFRRILNNTVADSSLTPLSINHIIKRNARLANLSNIATITPHSLRRGLATSAARAKASVQTIMRAGRWKQVNTVMEYIEANARFEESAAKDVLNQINKSEPV